jgi:glycine betaine catabolism B
MFAALERVDNTAANIRTFWFKPERPFGYVAGQFTELYLPHEPADARGQKHWFTISSSPTESLFSITTKFARDRSSTYKNVLKQLPLGSRAQFAEPMGDFVLPKDKRIPLVFVAGGMGITPVRSMVKYLADTGEQRRITLLYDVHDVAELAFKELFTGYPLQFVPIVSPRPAGWNGEAGRVAASHILQAVGDSTDTLIYLSGPEIMVETLYGELKDGGLPGRRLITDYFHGYRDV